MSNNSTHWPFFTQLQNDGELCYYTRIKNILKVYKIMNTLEYNETIIIHRSKLCLKQ